MNRVLKTTLFFALMVGLVFRLSGCKEKKENYGVMTAKEMYQSTAKMIKGEPNLSEILDLQQRVMTNPTERDLRQKLGMVAVDTIAGVVLTVGIGIPNPEVTSSALQKQQARQAALIDAARWTAYHLQWQRDGYTTDFGQISTSVPGGTILKEEILPDGRCVVLVQSPLVGVQ